MNLISELPSASITTRHAEDIPDIWSVESHLICSEKCKAALETIDPEFSECTPLPMLDKNGNVLETKRQYYWLNLRRFVLLKPESPNITTLPFIPTKDEAEYLGSAVRSQNIAFELQKLPVWRLLGFDPLASRLSASREVFYINQSTLESLNTHNLSGLNLFSCHNGANEESICPLPLSSDRP